MVREGCGIRELTTKVMGSLHHGIGTSSKILTAGSVHNGFGPGQNLTGSSGVLLARPLLGNYHSAGPTVPPNFEQDVVTAAVCVLLPTGLHEGLWLLGTGGSTGLSAKEGAFCTTSRPMVRTRSLESATLLLHYSASGRH